MYLKILLYPPKTFPNNFDHPQLLNFNKVSNSPSPLFINTTLLILSKPARTAPKNYFEISPYKYCKDKTRSFFEPLEGNIIFLRRRKHNFPENYFVIVCCVYKTNLSFFKLCQIKTVFIFHMNDPCLFSPILECSMSL